MSAANKARAAGVAVLVALAVLLAWATIEASRFSVGDTVAVTAEVVACGSVRVEAGGEQWQSEEQHLRSGIGGFEGGTLSRRSHNEATFTADADGLVAEMQRIRDDYFWPLGCLHPEAQAS